MADLDALFAALGTSAVEIDELAVSSAIQSMKKLDPPVTVEEIAAFIDECDPDLQPVLRPIDAARAADKERGKRRGKSLTIEQRQTILATLRQNVSGTDIARTFNILQAPSPPTSVSGQKTKKIARVLWHNAVSK